MVKILAVAFIVRQNLDWISDPFLPFLAPFDALRSSAQILRWLLRGTFSLAAIALVCNLRVRLSSFVLGAVIWFNVLISRPAYQTNLLFCGSLFLLVGLYDKAYGSKLIRWQIAILYSGAALNKLLDADWQSGVMIDNWSRLLASGATPPSLPQWPATAYLRLAAWFPNLWLAKLLCWGTILVESLLAIACFRSWRRVFVWGGIAFHTGLTFFAGVTFNMYFYVMLACRLVLCAWPLPGLTVVHDETSRLWARVRRVLDRIDFDGVFHWRAVPHEGAGPVRVIVGDRTYRGFRAIKILALQHSASYVVFLLALTLATARGSGIGYGPAIRWLAVLGAVFWSPLLDPLADLVMRRAPAREQ